ncbi:MAG: DUF3467 domain-containing protein [Candidatus Kerfeldbacteria bacterium]|nr:DUF3467 domain-containing protein [Candidatus Kerfeldbacteria bacterium]
MANGQPSQQINIQSDPATLRGVYANMMFVVHTPEEFVMDFMNIVPAQQQGHHVARIVTSPGHLKRIIAALAENLKRYEAQHGPVKAASEPPGAKEIGFRAG